MLNPSSARFVRKGLTLVEVVAGIALLATILVTMLIAYRANAEQIRKAHDRKLAIELLDELLANWEQDLTVPVPGETGVFEDSPWSWRVVKVRQIPSSELPYGAIRVEVLHTAIDGQSDVLATVEMLSEAIGAQ